MSSRLGPSSAEKMIRKYVDGQNWSKRILVYAIPSARESRFNVPMLVLCVLAPVIPWIVITTSRMNNSGAMKAEGVTIFYNACAKTTTDNSYVLACHFLLVIVVSWGAQVDRYLVPFVPKIFTHHLSITSHPYRSLSACTQTKYVRSFTDK